jgi:hypothetical protein
MQTTNTEEAMMIRPECEKCKTPMIFSFAIDYCEYVCFKCCIGVPFYNNNKEVEVSLDYDEKYRKRNIYKKSKLLNK